MSVSVLPQPTGPLWCEDFDADLPKVVPGALDVLGPTADVQLITYSHAHNGRINCPAAWHTDHGLTAFFATRSYGGPAPAGYVAPSKQIVACTFWEAVRDEWVHDAAIVVNSYLVWKPPVELMMRLMFHLRGWTPLADEERAETVMHVWKSLGAARRRLETVLGPKASEPHDQAAGGNETGR